MTDPQAAIRDAYLAAYAAANPQAVVPVLERGQSGWLHRHHPAGRIVARYSDVQLVSMTMTLAGKAVREAA